MKERFDIHQHITNQIIAILDRGAGEFRLPWNRGGNIARPTNIETKKAYQGVNVVALWAASEDKGYSSGVWGTFRQWTAAGASVQKGEKASYVVFYKEIESPADESSDGEASKRLFARATPVFATEQVEGFSEVTPKLASRIEPLEAVETFVTFTKALLHHGGGRAFYRPSTDAIHMPPKEAFVGSETSSPAEAYYGTLLHELTHNAELSVMPRRSGFAREARPDRRFDAA